jgi:hypothetical protein
MMCARPERVALLFVLAVSCVACRKSATPTDDKVARPSAPAAPVHVVPPTVASRPNPQIPPPPFKSSAGVTVDEEFAKHSIRNVSFEEPMTAALAKQLGGQRAMEAACKESYRQEPVEISQTVFGDLDGDGADEAAVTAISCQAGNAGPDLFAVFKQTADGEIHEMPFEARKWIEPFKGRDPSIGLRSAPTIAIENGKLVKGFPIFRDKDGGCCATGGTRKFIYCWDGHQFVLDDIIDVPPDKAGN